MKFALTLGVALAAVTLAASAHTSHSRTVIRHGGVDINFDADSDGWLTRAEASAAADRVFEQLDSDDDGRLTSADRRAFEDIHVRVDMPDIDVDVDVPDVDFDFDGPGVHRFEFEDEHGNRRVIVRRGEDLTEEEREEIEREIERAMEGAEEAMERAEEAAERASRHAERQARQAERAAREAERRAHRAAHEAERYSSREVVIIRADGDDHHALAPLAPTPPTPPAAAVAPLPPRPPMFMMLMANSEEADLNGDDALSREEFRAQHLRFFDASDANGDGRIRFERPPAPPRAPAPPAPPEPPRRR
ncbi:MAG TPA: hypothetical protein VEA80_17680 [Vitreimonas sp.]|uniref:hypothetical protein n=1 Tax=Vitreimonas sp. TaxID=3069702 RepID=UPI002D2B98B8|nr:hypothetical protein [Vitreimonas sp.]HYD89314.1 hypothetical protein [Vitreimonas sp.]